MAMPSRTFPELGSLCLSNMEPNIKGMRNASDGDAHSTSGKDGDGESQRSFDSSRGQSFAKDVASAEVGDTPRVKSPMATAAGELPCSAVSEPPAAPESYCHPGESKEAGAIEAYHSPGVETLEDVKIAVIGNVDSGKSTVVGVLTSGVNDDGRGLARSRVFNYAHELKNGRTASMAQEIMGFQREKQVFPPSQHSHGPTSGSDGSRLHLTSPAIRNHSWAEVLAQSSKLITFMDLCGHEKYLKTTIFGLIGCFPDYAMIVVGANMGIQRMTREHLGIALALRVPVFIVVTKIDIAPPAVCKQTLTQLSKLLKHSEAKKLPLVVKEESDVDVAARSIEADRICPIFRLSSVTGEGVDLLRRFLSLLSDRREESGLYRSPDDPVEFHVDGVYQVPGVGTVLAGTVKSGSVSQNQQLLVGPDKTGHFKLVTVRSVHLKRVPVNKVVAGQAASFAVRATSRKDCLKRSFFRKGMVLLDKSVTPKTVWEFEAEVLILHHATTIKEKYQAVIHCGVTRQSAQVKRLEGELLRTGDSGRIQFRFMYHPEYLCPDMPLIFREGRTKGLGKIVHVGPE